MGRYKVFLQTSTEVCVEVEAEDQDAAVEVAYARGVAGICAQCSGWGQDWWKDEGEYEPSEVVNAETDETVWKREDR